MARKLEEGRAAALGAKADGKPFVLVLNHESAWRTGDTLLKPTWGLFVNDESHRSTSTPRSRFYRWAWRVKAEKRACLSGTPMSHSPLSIWPQWKLLAPQTCDRTFTMFKGKYCIMGGYAVNGRAVQVVGFKDLPDLERRMAPIVDRVRKVDVLDLPPVVHEERVVDLPPEARKVYEAMEEEMIAAVGDGAIVAGNVLAKSVRLRQIVQGHGALDGGGHSVLHTAKADALAEILSDLPPTEPVVVFCAFHHDLDAVAAVAREADRPCNELSGRRNDVGAVWKPAPGAVAAIQVQAGGVGVDLTASAYAVYLAQTWSLSDFDQSLARLDRPGQTRSVTYLHVLADRTIDRTIRKALAARRSLVEAVMERMSRIAAGAAKS